MPKRSSTVSGHSSASGCVSKNHRTISSFWAGSRLQVEYTKQGLGPRLGSGLVLIGRVGGNDDDDADDEEEEDDDEDLPNGPDGRSNRNPFASSCRCSITTDSLVRWGPLKDRAAPGLWCKASTSCSTGGTGGAKKGSGGVVSIGSVPTAVLTVVLYGAASGSAGSAAATASAVASSGNDGSGGGSGITL